MKDLLVLAIGLFLSLSYCKTTPSIDGKGPIPPLSKDTFPSIPKLKKEKHSSVEEIKSLTKKITKKKNQRIESIRANKFFRQKLWHKGKRIERIYLKGNAQIQQKNYLLKAQEIRIENKKNIYLERKVKISLIRKGIHLYSNKAFFDFNKKLILLQGNTHIKVTSKKSTLLLTSSLIQYEIKTKKIFINGPLHASFHLKKNKKESLANLFAEQGVYEVEKQKLNITKDPIILSTDYYLTGKSLSLNLSKNEFLLEGNSIGYFYTFHHPFSSKKRKIDLLTLKAKKIVFSLPENIEAWENVTLDQKSTHLSSSYLFLSESKKEKENLIARGKVKVKDEEQNSKFGAKEIRYQKKINELQLKENAYLHFKKKKEENESTIYADYIVHNFSQKATQAQSNVKLERDDYKIKGEWMNYDEKKEKLLIEGNAKLLHKNTFLSSEKIILYTKSGKLIFPNVVQGKL